MYFPVNAYYFVTKNDIEKYTELMFRISYFGKKCTKETIVKGIRRVGQGFTKPKPCSCKPQHARVKDIPKTSTDLKVSTLSYCFAGKLDKYFLGEAELPMFHRRRSYYELYDEENGGFAMLLAGQGIDATTSLKH